MLKHIKNKGFTLIELIVVIAILGILALIAVPRVVGSVKTARINTIGQNLATVTKAINAYYAQTGKLPGDTGASATSPDDLLNGKTLTSMGMTYYHQKDAGTTYNLSVVANATPYNLSGSDITTANFPSPYVVCTTQSSGGDSDAVIDGNPGTPGVYVELQEANP